MSNSNAQTKSIRQQVKGLIRKQSDTPLINAVNDSYAKLNETWAEAEADLLKFSVPVEVVHEIGGYDDNCHYLGFVQHQGKWRICWGYSSNSDDPGSDQPWPFYYWTPMAECSLATRLSSVEHFLALRKKVREAAEKTVTDIRQAIDKLSIDLL